MKLLLLSDSHGAESVFYSAYDAEKPDKVLFAGDGIRGMLEFRDCWLTPAVETRIVCGNCDFDFYGEFVFSQPVNAAGHRIFLTHGHREHVKTGLSYLTSAARLEGCDIAVFGHTHEPLSVSKDGILLVNPGAAASGRYGILEIDTGGVSVSLKRV